MGPATPYMLRRNTASIMKRFFDSVVYSNSKLLIVFSENDACFSLYVVRSSKKEWHFQKYQLRVTNCRS